MHESETEPNPTAEREIVCFGNRREVLLVAN